MMATKLCITVPLSHFFWEMTTNPTPNTNRQKSLLYSRYCCTIYERQRTPKSSPKGRLALYMLVQCVHLLRKVYLSTRQYGRDARHNFSIRDTLEDSKGDTYGSSESSKGGISSHVSESSRPSALLCEEMTDGSNVCTRAQVFLS